jgi:hypothetical protein
VNGLRIDNKRANRPNVESCLFRRAAAKSYEKRERNA